MVNSQKKYLDPDLLFVRRVDLVLTEKCSLKCKDSHIKQYYENPVNIDKQASRSIFSSRIVESVASR